MSRPETPAERVHTGLKAGVLQAVPALPHVDLWRVLGRRLLHLGYNAHAATTILGLPGWTADSLDTLFWEIGLLDSGPTATLVRALLQGEPVRVGAARRHLPEELGRLGLLEQRGGEVRARRCFFPLGDEHISVADSPRVALTEPDSVFLPDSSTMALRRCQPYSPVGRHLDLGCGSGAVALAAAHWADEVVLVDINPRAPAMAKESFALSGLQQPQAYAGSVDDAPMVGPVDRISFVLPLLQPWTGMGDSPIHTLAARPDLLDRTLAVLPPLLRPGGLALLYCQCATEAAPAHALLDQAFGSRPWRGGLWWEAEEDILDGTLKVGVIAIQADVPGGWREARNTERDEADVWWWPALRRDLGLE